MKYLLPWAEVFSGYCYFIRFALFSSIKFVIYRDIDNKYYYWETVFDTKEAAMNYLDKILLEQGWIFVDEKRAEKLKLLL